MKKGTAPISKALPVLFGFFVMGFCDVVGVIGFACSSIFPILYGKAITARPDKANEISGLMITGVFGGAIVTALMGYATEKSGTQSGSLMVITLCICYLTFLAFGLKTVKK